MRFRIHIDRLSKQQFIPINYQYELSSVIYKIIHRSDSEFSHFLHSRGYIAFGKQFRLFTFSRLSFDRYKVIKEAGRIEHYGTKASFEISFLVDRAAEEFIKGLFREQEFGLGDKISAVDYQVSSIEACTPPVFKDVMHYRALSPLFIRRKRSHGGEDYLSPEHPDYLNLFAQNLLSKSKAYQEVLSDSELPMEGAPKIELKPLGKIYKNGVKIKQMTAEQSMLIGYMFEFELSAPAELQEIGYYAGLGHLNSQGFGCVEKVVESTN